MSSFSRRSLILSLAALPACGFTPVYGPASSLRGTVKVGTPDSSNAFALVRALEFRLGAVEVPRYQLRVGVDITEEGSVITPTQEIDRFTLTGESRFSLETVAGASVTTGSVRAFSSYSASDTPMATRAARDDAQERLMEILADLIVTRLAGAIA
ncbi:MAG: LPS assembly lipoprotein LptE [Pseudomonadota bacterium]